MSKPARLYKISGGQSSWTLIPIEGILIHSVKEVGAVPVWAYSSDKAPENEHFESSALDCLIAVASVLTPWATWYASPAISNDEPWISVAGQAYIYAERAIVRSSMKPADVIRVAFHEAFHLAEDYLSLEERRTVNSGMNGVPLLPNDDFHRYYSSAQEVRANAFSYWAFSYWLRGRMPEYRKGMPADERIWTMIYRGDLGIRVARKGLIPASRQPAHIKAALAERSASQLMFDATCRTVCAIKGWLTDNSKASEKVAA